MAPLSAARSYYYELYDRTLVPGANLEEHKVGAIHRGLMEVSGKMMRCQLQVFQKDLKVGRRKQKLPSCRLNEPSWRMVARAGGTQQLVRSFFSLDCVLSGFFFFFLSSAS